MDMKLGSQKWIDGHLNINRSAENLARLAHSTNPFSIEQEKWGDFVEEDFAVGWMEHSYDLSKQINSLEIGRNHGPRLVV